MDKHEILANPGQARDRAFENGYANLVFLDLSPGSIAEIRRAVEKYEPLAVFVDQMANMECRSENKVEKNEILAARLRALAKKYDIITFIIHQASESAYSKLVLEKNDMYFSNVGVQGQMDLMLGIGSDAWHEQQNRRVMSITKNKISGDHSYFPITVNPSKSQIVA
jgi:hypothetical protein